MTGTLLGYRKDGSPIWPVWGGADDDPEPTPEPVVSQGAEELAAMRAELEAANARASQTEERLRALMAGNEPAPAPVDDDEDDSEGEPEPGKPVDPELAKLRRALRAANKESKARREAAEKLRAEWDAQDLAHKSQVAEAQRLAEAADAARREAEAKYKPATIKAAAMPALLEAGAKPDRANRLVKLLDMAALDVDATGAVTGLAEQVAAVKAEWPELFKSDEDEKPRAPRVATGDRPPVQDKPMTSAQVLARQVLGGLGGAA